MYNLELTYDVLQPSLFSRSIEVELLGDKNAPNVERFFPDAAPKFAEQIEIQVVFSEPLDTTKISDGTFELREKETKVELSHQWRDAFHLLLKPIELKEGFTYRLAVTEFDLIDLAGNVLGDTLREFAFTSLSSDSLGSISGEVVMDIAGKADDPAMLFFKKVGGRQVHDLQVSGRSFKIEVPAGKYLLTGFIDSDFDGEKGNGTIQPFRLAETSAVHPDTIAVRARFETAGIKFEFR
jgi:hypothetical protein